MKRKIVACLCVMTMTIGLLTGCGGQKTDEKGEKTESKKEEVVSKSEDGVFTMAINSMPASLQPKTVSDDQVSIVRPIYEPLFADTKDGLEYYLADSMEISDDAKTYTIHINEKANWSDGEPVTVDDVLFSIDYNGVNSNGKSSYNTINGKAIVFNKKDDKTLEMVLPEAFATYTANLGRLMILPSHAFDNDPTKVDGSEYFTSTDMTTSGAYTVLEINEDNIVYEARNDYYRGTPQVKKIIMKTIGAGSTKQIAFENNEISYMRVTTKEELEKYENSDDYNIYSISEGRLNYLQINPYGPANEKLTDDARKAICLALNDEEIVDAAYGAEELARTANSLLTPDQSLYNKDCKGYEQNLEEAKALAKSSGLEGQTLVYIYNNERSNMEEIATVIQQQLQEIGVNVDVQGLDSSTFFDKLLGHSYGNDQEKTWDLATNGWDSERGGNLGQAYTYINHAKYNWGFSEEARALAVQVNSATSESEAKELAKDLQDLALSECWEYPLTYTNYVMVAQKNVKGLDGNSVVPEFIDWLTISVE